MTDHVFLRIMQLKMFGFQFVFLNCLHHRITNDNCNNVVSLVCTVFVILCWYTKKWDPRSCPGTCQLKMKHFSPEILKFSTKHEDNPFTLNCYIVLRTFLFIFHAVSRRMGSNNFRKSSYKEKTAGSARVSRLSFRFLWLWSSLANILISRFESTWLRECPDFSW